MHYTLIYTKKKTKKNMGNELPQVTNFLFLALSALKRKNLSLSCRHICFVMSPSYKDSTVFAKLCCTKLNNFEG